MIVAGIDIGSQKIKGVLCEVTEDGHISFINKAERRHNGGIKSGNLVDLEKTIYAISDVKQDLEASLSEQEISFYLVSVSGKTIDSHIGKAMIPLWEREDDVERKKITKEHIKKAVRSARLSYTTDEKTAIHSFNQEFIIDDATQTANPLGMTGKKLSCEVYTINCEKNTLENLDNVLSEAGIKNYRVIYSPVATAEAIVPDEAKEGVIMISMGAGTTELVIFYDGILRTASVVPFGSDFVTNDLKKVLAIDYRTAEDLKIEEGCALKDMIDKDAKVIIDRQIDGKTEVKLPYIADIISARIKEIFEFTIDKIYKSSYQKKIDAPIIVSGGGMQLEGADLLLERMLQIKTIYNSVRGVEGIEGIGYEYYTAVGLVKYGVKHNLIKGEEKNDDDEQKNSMFGKFKKFLSDIL